MIKVRVAIVILLAICIGLIGHVAIHLIHDNFWSYYIGILVGVLVVLAIEKETDKNEHNLS